MIKMLYLSKRNQKSTNLIKLYVKKNDRKSVLQEHYRYCVNTSKIISLKVSLKLGSTTVTKSLFVILFSCTKQKIVSCHP